MKKSIGSAAVFAIALMFGACNTTTYTVKVLLPEGGLPVGKSATVDIVRCSDTEKFGNLGVSQITNAQWFYKPTACYNDAVRDRRLDRWVVSDTSPKLDPAYRIPEQGDDRDRSILRADRSAAQRDCILIAASVPDGDGGNDSRPVEFISSAMIKEKGRNWIVRVGNAGIQVEAAR